MRYQTGESFSYATNSAAATCSFTLSAATRKVVIQNLVAYSDLTAAVVTVQASGTTKWAMILGSAGIVQSFPGLTIETEGAATLSCNVTATGQANVAICGQYILL